MQAERGERMERSCNASMLDADLVLTSVDVRIEEV